MAQYSFFQSESDSITVFGQSDNDLLIDQSQTYEQFFSMHSEVDHTILPFSGAASVSYRGQSANAFPLILNGVQLNAVSSRFSVWDTIPLEFLSRVLLNTGIEEGLSLQTSTPQKSKLLLSTGSYQQLKSTLHFNSSKSPVSFSLQRDQAKNDFLYTSISSGERLRWSNNDYKKDSLMMTLKETSLSPKVNYLYSQMEQGIPGVIGRHMQTVRSSRHLEQWQVEKNYALRDVYGTVSFSYTNQVFNYLDEYGEVDGFIHDYQRDLKDYHGQNSLSWQGKKWHWQGIFELGQTNYQDRNIQANRAMARGLLESEYYLTQNLHIVASVARPRFSDVVAKTDWSLEKKFKTKYATYYARVSRRYRYPTLDELYLIEGQFVGNEELDSEKNTTYELGIRSNFFSSSFFYRQTENLIRPLMTGGFRFRPFNIAQSDNYGVNLKLQKQIQKFFLRSSLSWQRPLDTTNNTSTYRQIIPNMPQASGQLSAEYSFLPGQSLKLLHTLSLGRMMDELNTRKIPNKSYSSVIWQLKSKGYAVRARVNNIQDNEVFDFWGFPQMGRNLEVSVANYF